MRPEHLVLGILLGALPFLAASPAALISVYMLAFIPYAVALRAPVDIRIVIGLALVLRVFLSVFEPVLSDDLYRYVWEGRVSLAGLNPFSLAPSDVALTHLRDAWIWPSVNHPEIPTIYPPVSQGIFALNAIWEGGTTSMRLIFVVMELGLLALATRWLEPSERNFLLPAYLLNPLIIVELGWSGHLDVVAYMSLFVALLIWQRGAGLRWTLAAGLMLGLSISTKFLGVMALGLMLLSPGPRALKDRVILGALSVCLVAASYLPFLSAGADLFSGFGTYAASWRSNDMVFRLVYVATEFGLQIGHSEKLVFDVFGGSLASDQVAATAGKGIAVLVLAIVFGYSVVVVRDAMYGFLLLMLTLLIMAPTVHPWYVAWLIPFAALMAQDRRAIFLSSFFWSGTVVLAYTAWHSYHGGGPWVVPDWAVALQALSLVLGFGLVGRVWVFGENDPK